MSEQSTSASALRSRLSAQADECLILVKALPHRSSNYFETVCCAGVGRDHKWRRLYPVPFRVLQDGQKFTRWDWVSYDYTPPGPKDQRRESQKVNPSTIKVGKCLKASERSRLARMLTRASTREAESKSETLTLVSPSDVALRWRKKTAAELETERQKHADLVSQASFLNESAEPLDPCPYEFELRWCDADGKRHTNISDDWESSAAFFHRRAAHGE